MARRGFKLSYVCMNFVMATIASRASPRKCAAVIAAAGNRRWVHHLLRHSEAARALCGQSPTAFAGLQTRTPQAAQRASATDDASNPVFRPIEQKLDSGFRRR